MKIRYAVTFEFETRAPLTHRGTSSGGQASVCAVRAIRAAQVELRPVGWTSMVFCALERVGEETDTPTP